MRILKMALFVSCLAVPAAARPALADPPAAREATSRPQSGARSRAVPALDLSLPSPAFPWAVPRANVASLGLSGPLELFPRPRLYSGGQTGLRVSGSVVLGLGILTLFGAGITGIVAAAQSSRLGDDCPGKVCYEGTRGAERLQSVRDTALAADWLLGIGAPVTASGVVLLLYSAVVQQYGLVDSKSPIFRASPGGGGMMFHF